LKAPKTLPQSTAKEFFYTIAEQATVVALSLSMRLWPIAATRFDDCSQYPIPLLAAESCCPGNTRFNSCCAHPKNQPGFTLVMAGRSKPGRGDALERPCNPWSHPGPSIHLHAARLAP